MDFASNVYPIYQRGTVTAIPRPDTPRSERKTAKAKARYVRDFMPKDYASRKQMFTTELVALSKVYETSMQSIKNDIATAQSQSAHCDTPKSRRACRSRQESLQSLMESRRLSYEAELDRLILKYHDVVDYESGLAAF